MVPWYLSNKTNFEQTQVLHYLRHIYLVFSKHHTEKDLPPRLSPIADSLRLTPQLSSPPPPGNQLHFTSLPLVDDVFRDEIMVRCMLFSSSGRCMELGAESSVFLGSSYFWRSPVSLLGCWDAFGGLLISAPGQERGSRA